MSKNNSTKPSFTCDLYHSLLVGWDLAYCKYLSKCSFTAIAVWKITTAKRMHVKKSFLRESSKKEWIPRRYLLILPREINLMMSEIMFSNSWWAEIDVTTYFVWSVEEEFCGEGKNWTWALLLLHAETLNKHFFLSFSLLRNLHYAFEVVLCYIITWLITKRNFSLQRNKISRQIQSSRQHKTVHKTYPK